MGAGPRLRLVPRWRPGLPAAALTLAVLLGPGCERERIPPDTIVVLCEDPIARMDPRYAALTWETRVSRLVAPGLTGLADRDLGPGQGIAESVVQEDPLTYRATLRADSRFPDGRVVDAEDVKYTFDSVRDPLLGSPWRKTWDDILVPSRGVEIVDARTVRFHLRAPRAPFLTDVESLGAIDRHQAQPLDEAVRAAARAGRRPPPWDPVREVVGAGAYRLVARSADVVEMERNPHARQPPASARMVVRTIRDDNSRVLALMGGSADIIENGLSTLVLETLEKDPRLRVDYGRSATVTYLAFNLEDKILGDVRVRQAIAMALDRPRMITAKLGGHAVLARGIMDTSSPFAEPAAREWPHDPAAARQLLDQAGYPDPDGPGPRPRFELSWKTTSVRFRVAMAQVMGRMLGEVGIDVEVRPFDRATFMDDVRKGNFQLFSLQFSDLIEPDNLRAMVRSSRIPTAENNWAGLNRFRYRNPQMDAWLDEGVAASDPERRRWLYRAVQRLLNEELPLFALWHEDNFVVRRRNIGGVQVLKNGSLEGLLGAAKPAPERGGGQ